jgi:hypothetical protein
MTIAEQLQQQYDAATLQRILACAADHSTHTDGDGRVRQIRVRDIVADAWNQRRLTEALARLDQGERPPPIDAYGHRLPDGSLLYTLGDGMHRTVAARLRQRAMIRARVRGQYRCIAQPLVLYREALWRAEVDHLTLKMSIRHGEDPSVVEGLRLLGLVKALN